ncbi:MAG: protein kinase [Polyangiales bacterium]
MADVFEQFGPYTRIRRLGVGGMAETFLAVQRAAAGFEQRVCMKFILPAYRENADFQRLFLREASIAASLRHSNIVGVIDVDAAAGYMVLELVDGVDLRTLVNAAAGRRLDTELTTWVAIELCKALAYAHGRQLRGQADGIVHRDLSPSNVLVSYAGEVKLTDFGVARAMRADAEPPSATVKGKLCYMSPEQARGHLLDGRSDLFSLGVMFYELLAGVRPFDGATDADTLLRIASGQHVSLLDAAPHVPTGLALVVEKLLQSDRELRFSTADECLDALAPFAPPTTSFRELGRLARAARPHQTLVGVELEPGWVPPKPRGMITETQPLPHETRPPRPLPAAPLPPLPALVAEPASVDTTTGVGTRAWIALGLSFVVLLLVGITWLAQVLAAGAPSAEKPPIAAAAPSVSVKPLATPSPAPSLKPPTTGATTSAPRPTTLPEPTREPSPQPTAAAPAEPSAQRPARVLVNPDPPAPSPPPSAAAQREATLNVGVIPTGQVWIDNRPYGYSPVRGVKLKPGRHTIEGGATRPQVQRQVTLKPGELRQLALSLDTGAVFDDGEDTAPSEGR